MSSSGTNEPEPRPPFLTRYAFSLLLGEGERRFALADLEEEFGRRAIEQGPRRARRWYRGQLLKSVLPVLRMRVGSLGSLDTLGPDVRYALRTLRRTPVTVAAIVLSLGLGIGALTTVFVVVNQVVRAAPVGLVEPDRLVTVYTSEEDGNPFGTSSFPDYRDVAAGIDALESVAVSSATMLTLTHEGAPESLLAEEVSSNYFEVTGLRPLVGRPFRALEVAADDGVRVAVIGHDLWRRRFAEDPGVIGSRVQLDGRDYTVIGVAPDGVVSRRVPLEPDVWIPLRTDITSTAATLEDRRNRQFIMIGRTALGRSQSDVETQLAVVGQRLSAEHAEAWRDARGGTRFMRVVSEKGSRVNPRARALLAGVGAFFLSATGLVLLIACTNVMGLILARVSRRKRELAVRSALGASRGRIMGMLLTEGMIPGLLGGVLGVGVAWVCTQRLSRLSLPVGLPVRIDVELDTIAIVFALSVSLMASLTFAVLPALQASRSGPSGFREDEGVRSIGRGGRFNLRSAMVIVQCAASAALLTGASLFLRALDAATELDLGVNTERMAIASKALDETEFSEAEGLQYFEDLLGRIESHPDISTAHLSRGVELTLMASVVEVADPNAQQGFTPVPSNAVSPGYLETMGIEIVRGRSVEARDRSGAPLIAVVTETFAQRYWPGEDPLGRTFEAYSRRWATTVGQEEASRTLQIVGIAEDGRYVDFDDQPSPYFWTSAQQDYSPTFMITAQGVRSTEEGIAVLANAIQVGPNELQRVRPSPLAEHVSFQFLHLRIASKVLGIGGAFGMLLAAIGVYGMVSFAAARRAKEMAIRLALGAGRNQVFRQISAEGMRLAAIGLVLGFAVAIPVAHLLRGVLAGIGPLDPPSILRGAGALMLVAVVASAGPALRSTRLQPMETLREE